MSSKAKIYLYKEGNECVSLTGGWDENYTNIREPEYKKTNAVVSKGDNSVTVSITKTFGMALIGTTNKIDISKFNKIVTDTEHSRATSSSTSSWSGLCFDSDKNFTNSTVEYLYQDVVGPNIKEVELDINEHKYIFFYVSHGEKNVATGQKSSYSINNVYLQTNENVISINSQNTSSINFSCNNLDNLITITKAEVYINNKLSETYEDNFENLTYTIDNSLCGIGKNNITIKVIYTQGDDIYETVEEILTHVVTVNNLPTTSSLKDVMDRQELLNNSIEVQKNNLKNILVSKNVEIAEEEDKLSNLIDKVNMCDYTKKIFLYKDNNEYLGVTGGWLLSVVATSSYGSITLTKNDNYMNLTTPSGNNSGTTSRGTLYSKNYIDVSEYNKLHFEVLANINGTQPHERLTFEIKNEAGASLEKNAYKYFLNKKRIETLDISNINTSVKIHVYLDADGTSSNPKHYINIYKIWLEK